MIPHEIGPGLGARHTEETRPRTDVSKRPGVSLHLTPHEALLFPVTRTFENTPSMHSGE